MPNSRTKKGMTGTAGAGRGKENFSWGKKSEKSLPQDQEEDSRERKHSSTEKENRFAGGGGPVNRQKKRKKKSYYCEVSLSFRQGQGGGGNRVRAIALSQELAFGRKLSRGKKKRPPVFPPQGGGGVPSGDLEGDVFRGGKKLS